MCGINGIIAGVEDIEGIIKAMHHSIMHRGPDAHGFVVYDHAAFGASRLAMVDAKNKAADQPMTSGEYTLVFNGEIFNHKNIRAQLQEQGVMCDTDCDTEVLLKGFAAYGTKILEQLNGQFAFGIHNNTTGETVIARDRTAIKPLYYSTANGRFVFSSSPRAILSSGIKFTPNLEGICAQMLSGATFAAGEVPLCQSQYHAIAQVKPGEYLVINRKGEIVRQDSYYALPVQDVTVPTKKEEQVTQKQGYIKVLRKKVIDAIVSQIPAEVPVGVMLSGGLDSSIIAYVAAQQLHKTNPAKKVIVSTIRYLLPEMNKGTNRNEGINEDRKGSRNGSGNRNEQESEEKVNKDYHYAKRVYQKMKDQGFNVEFHSCDITPDNLLDNLEEMVRGLGIHDSIRQLAMFANYKVLSDNGVKAVLVGEGSDEFNWGYWKSFPGLATDQKTGTCKTAEGFKRMLKKRACFVKSLFAESVQSNLNMDNSAEYLSKIYGSFNTRDPTRRMMGVYAVEFLGFLNKANDGCAMQNGIEARVPYQDTHVMETALKIPREYQTDSKLGIEKDVLKQAFREELSRTGVLERPKMPLPAAAHITYHERILEEYERRMKGVHPSFWEYFNKDTFVRIKRSFRVRMDELMQETNDPYAAGQKLVAWRDIGMEEFDVLGKTVDGVYVAGKEIRTNDIFKLLTAMVWYNQNYKDTER